MIRGLSPKLKEINEAIVVFEQAPSSHNGGKINGLFHEVIHLLEGHELSIDDAMELQMTVNRWSNTNRVQGHTGFEKEINTLKEIVNTALP